MSATLVNIQQYGQAEQERVLGALIQPVHPKYKELILAITEFWHACGSKGLCTDCFMGKFVYKAGDFAGNHYYLDEALQTTGGMGWDDKKKRYVSRGCCGNCPLLTNVGCARKPVMCTGYSCGTLFHMIPNELREVYRELAYEGKHSKGAYVGGYLIDSSPVLSGWSGDPPIDQVPEWEKATKKWKALTRKVQRVLSVVPYPWRSPNEGVLSTDSHGDARGLCRQRPKQRRSVGGGKRGKSKGSPALRQGKDAAYSSGAPEAGQDTV